MKLTPLEIKQQKFEKSLRGYDPTEVHSFLNLVSNEWEHLAGKNRELQQKIENLHEKLKHYERVEEALHETLQAAKESAETKLVGARKEADHTIDQAEMQAEKIVRNAKQERQQIRQSIMRLLDRRKEIVSGIQSYLQVAKESIEQFDKDAADIFDRPNERQELLKDEQDEEAELKAKKDKQVSPPNPSESATANPPGTENIDDLVDDLE